MQRNKYILVTGGAGYIGSHTVVELVNTGFEPIIVDDFRNASEKVLNGLFNLTGKEIPLHRIDVCDEKALEGLFNTYHFDGIIHFAALKAVGESVEQPLQYYSNNLNALINVLSLAVKFGVHNFVFSSSCTVYGDPDNGSMVTESTPQGYTPSPYGASKQMGERIISDVVNSSTKLKVLSLRYFNPIGAHPSSEIGELPLGTPNNLLPYVTQTAIGKRERLTVFGKDYPTSDGTCVRDYIHVCDLAEAHVKGMQWLIKQTDSGFEVMNVGTGKGTSVLEIIHTFENISGETLNWGFGDRRSGDIAEIFANTDKAEKILGWKAVRTMKDALTDAWNWELKLKNE